VYRAINYAVVACLHFRHVAPLRNQNASKATGFESRFLISHFLTLCKIKGGVGQMSE